MLVLCGLSVSNYYNKVKLALLEKGVPFEEERCGMAGVGAQGDDAKSASPLGKIPFLRTSQGPLCESQAILEYVEDAYPEPPLLPKDPYEAAKVRELILFIDLHVELVARELYPQAFFGKTVAPDRIERAATLLKRNVAAFAGLASFSPYVAGATFTQADCAAWASLGVVSLATQAVLGTDVIADAGIDWKTYSALIGERPSAQRVAADRKAETKRSFAAG